MMGTENQGEPASETSPMEIIKDGKRKITNISKEVEGDMTGGQENTEEQSMAGSENTKDMSTKEERIMKKLLDDWRNLDERFIPEKEKQVFKEAFQRYKEKKGESARQSSEGDGSKIKT